LALLLVFAPSAFASGQVQNFTFHKKNVFPCYLGEDKVEAAKQVESQALAECYKAGFEHCQIANGQTKVKESNWGGASIGNVFDVTVSLSAEKPEQARKAISVRSSVENWTNREVNRLLESCKNDAAQSLARECKASGVECAHKATAYYCSWEPFANGIITHGFICEAVGVQK
jgi:hypothetical protein